jgi:hypothetical protein
MLFLSRDRVGMYTHLDATIVSQRNFYSCPESSSKIRVWQMRVEWANLLAEGKVESPRAKRGYSMVERGKVCR